MKKLMLMLSVAGLATFSLNSCGKHHEEKPAIKQTITVQLETNEAYTFVLPKNLRNDEYRFTSQASHYSVSILGESTTGDRIYQYTPELNYVGADQVVVNNDWEKDEDHSGGPCNQSEHPSFGNCMGGGEEDHYIITFNFNIGREAVENSSAK